MKTNPTILLACSAGGHLTEMRQLAPFYQDSPHAFITFRRPDTESLSQKEKVHFIERPARNPLRTLQSFLEAWKIIRKEKPKMVVSTGADVTVPVCIAAKLQGIPIVFIESFCRPYTPSWSGRIISLFADRVIYQWNNPALKEAYPNGIYGGSIFVTE
jgi:UDP-N-acetylglucosamine:LPS N-acetylglucosamine transferase